MKYRSEIDGLRALAVLPVILFHAGFDWFSGGFVGVDVFFVISGYLITTIIISEMVERKFSIVNFYERRARRILPALFFVIAACLPFAWLWLTPTDLKDFGQSLVAVSTFSSNILFWLESGYFNTAAELKPLLHTWSLAVEEQYYILFPIFLTLTWRLGIKWVLILLSIIFFISLGFAQWGAYNKPFATFYLLPTRGWELLVGAFAAFYLKYNSHLKSQILNQVLSLIGFCMIVYSIIAFDETTPFPSLHALIPTIGTGLLIFCAVPKTFIHKLLSLKFIVGIGLISYSAYLWHQPLLAFTRHRFLGDTSDFIIIALCIASFVIAWFSWRFVEGPFRDKNIISSKAIYLFSAIGIFLFSSLGLMINKQNGFVERIDFKIGYDSIDNSPLRLKCHTNEIPCEYFGDSIEWATFGDSHVVELSYALADYLRQKNIGIQHNSYSSCQPSISINSSPCSKWSKETIDRLIGSPNIKNILVSFRLTSYMYGDSYLKYPNLPNEFSESERDIIWSDLLKIFDLLLENGKTVYFVVQPPELPLYMEQMVFWQRKEEKLTRGAKREWWDKRNSYVFNKLGDIPNQVKLVNPTEIFCDSKYCYGSDDKGYLYFDDNHVSLHGASIIVEKGIFNAEH